MLPKPSKLGSGELTVRSTSDRSMAKHLAWSALCLGLVPAIAGAAGCRPVRSASERPNIVIILADDLGYGDTGVYNSASKIPTPNIDRLAKDGMQFTDAHSPSAVCTPTRYGLLTGRYAWRTSLKRGVLGGYSPSLIEPRRMTLASLLRDQGYATAAIGKWHLGFGNDQKTDYARPLRPGPTTAGFDVFFGIPASLDMAPYLYVENDRPVRAATEIAEASEQRRKGGRGFWRGGPIAPGFEHDEVLPTITERAVHYIEERAAETAESAFFLYLALTAPHTPWVPTEAFRGRSQAGYYGDFVAQVDDTVGRVARALDRTGTRDNTLVIFTSDNGAHWLASDIRQYHHRANGHLRGQKADIWEGGHRVPFIARWPGRIKAGTESQQLICHTDLLATIAAIVGVDLPPDAGEDSFDMLPALLDPSAEEPLRDAVVHHSNAGVFAIRRGDWKLILGLGSGGFTEPRTVEPTPGGPLGQLYNLAKDPGEMTNLYAQHPEIVERLTSLLERYRREGSSRPARALSP